MTHHTDAELLRDIEEHMRKMWDARLLPAVCWPADLAQRLTQAVRRAPAAPASEPALEAALDAMDKEVTRMQPDRSVHWIGFTRDDRLRVVAAALAAAPQRPEAAPVVLPCVERIDVLDVANELKENISAFGDTKGKAKEKAAFYLVSQHEQILYWQQQVRDLLAAHGIKG